MLSETLASMKLWMMVTTVFITEEDESRSRWGGSTGPGSATINVTAAPQLLEALWINCI